jgi:serine O-acetyltransferase
VIGETAVIGDNVSILHHVTLGGTGKCCGNRHPRIGNGVLIGAAAILLGPITVGDGAKIGACSLVLIDVPPHTTAVGVPAQILDKGPKAVTKTGKELPALSMDHTSSIIDYII